MLIFQIKKYWLTGFISQYFNMIGMSLLCRWWLIFKSLLILASSNNNSVIFLLFYNTCLNHIINKLSCLLVLLCLLLSCNKLLLNHIQSSHLSSVFVLFLKLFLILIFDFSFCSSSFRSDLEHIDSGTV